MPRLFAIIVAVLSLAAAAGTGWGWVEKNKRQALRADFVQCQIDVELADRANAEAQRQIAEVSQLASDMANEIRIREEAVQEAEARSRRVERQRDQALAENASLLESIYADSCQQWAAAPVCAGVVEQWKLERRQLFFEDQDNG